MEQKIKNFDRNIEQRLNENAVTPPFGMWNRISVALDAEAMPVAVPAPASVMPKGAIVGMVTGALILGASLLTAYLINNNSLLKKEAVNNMVTVVNIPQVKNIETVVLRDEVKPAVVYKAKKVAVTPAVISEPVKEETLVSADYRNLAEVAVPDQTVALNTKVTEAYYFPPVDVNNPEPVKTKVIAKTKVDGDDQGDDDKKIKSSSSGHEKKLRPKKKRSRDWSFGRINRYRDPK